MGKEKSTRHRSKGIDDIVLLVNKEMKGTKTEAAAYTRAVFKALTELLKDGHTVRTPIGVFKVRTWKARIVRNKITGSEPVYVPERKVVTFTQSEKIKKLLNGERDEP